MFSLLVAAAISMSGTWMLPVKDYPTDLFLVHNGTKTNALLIINSNCKRPVSAPFNGTVAETKCGTLVYLESKGMKISKTCKLNAYIIACGRLQGNTFKSDGVISIDIMCKDKPIQHKVDDISGTWIRKPAKKVTM